MEALTPLFVAIPKTGSTSVAAALGVMQEHHRASHLSGMNGFRFAFVRNPLTRLLSAYNWLHQFGEKELYEMPFKEFVLAGIDLEHLLFRPQSWFLDAPLDFIGRYETLQQGFNEAQRRMGLPETILPRENGTVPNDPSVYDDETRELVRNLYSDDFKRFYY